MTIKRTPRPRDPIQLGKLMVDIATGSVPDGVEDGKDSAAIARGRLGGKSGGKARSEALDASKRSGIARTAAIARWAKAKDQ